MRSDYSQIFQDPTAVDKYDDIEYAPDSQASAVNRRQRRYLRYLVAARFGTRAPVQHDFACGTGRAIELLHGIVREAYGYDTSPQMLDRARAKHPDAHWRVITAAGPLPEPETTDPPAIVTVFRLLLNVPDEVRERAIAFAATVLPTGDAGLLIVQNHGSRRSLRHLRARTHANNQWFSELSDGRVYEIFERFGFELVDRKGCAIFPRGWYRPRPTRPIVRKLDDLLCKTRILDRYAVDVLYVARRTATAARGGRLD